MLPGLHLQGRRILENEARLQTLIDNTADAFLMLRQGGEIQDVNDRGCQHLVAPVKN